MPIPEGHVARPPISEATIDNDKFRAGLRRIIQDSAMRSNLERQPVAMFGDLGITIPDARRAEIADKSLTELMSRGGESEFWPEVFTGVVITVAVIVGW